MVRETESEPGVERFTGAYTVGTGRAHLNIGGAEKRAEHTQLFGCPMVGTFNVVLSPQEGGTTIKSKPFLTHDKDSYWLVRLRTGGQEVYAYAVRWEGSRMPENVLELLSRRPIPEHFKGGQMEITIYERWSAEQIERWQAALDDKTKWQGHEFWQPQRADGAYVWTYLREGYDYQGKTVLDIGCNAGYYAFRAAQRGAVVTGVEKNKDILGVARTIQNHIEMTDVEFRRGSYTDLLNRHYDFIFYLSVHHQHDERYGYLDATLGALLGRCDTLFLELINPPLSGPFLEKAVDTIVRKHGARELSHYKHRVRGERSLYAF